MQFDDIWADDDFEGDFSIRMPSLPGRHPMLDRILMEVIRDPEVAVYRRRAQFTYFAGSDPDQLGGYDGQLEVVGRCLEWFVFDFYIPTLAATPAQYWVEKNDADFTAEDRLIVRSFLEFIIGIFEISGVITGESFTAVDLLRPENKYVVQEQVASTEIQDGQLLLSRIFPLQGGYILSGMAVLMDEEATIDFKRVMREERFDAEYILRDIDGLELENLFNRSLQGIQCHSELPWLQQALRRYVEDINPGRISFKELLGQIQECVDCDALIEQLKGVFGLFNRHEIELIASMVRATWRQYWLKR